MRYEDEKIEFKRDFSDSIYKSVIAFANTNGGEILIGVDDKGNSIGLDNFDETYNKITNGIRDNIFPNVCDIVNYSHEEGNIIKITIEENSNKPFCLKSKGFRPEGVYIRTGASNSQTSWEMIKKMINNSNGVWEEQISINQDLSFKEAKEFFSIYNKEFDESKHNILKLVQKDYYTNLGMLLSDNCSHSIKVAVFSDLSCTVFRDKQEFKGSVCKQFEDTYKYLDYTNKTASVINGVQRIDTRDYPPIALREALLNAIIHRNYSYDGSIIININDTKIEFISIGGLMPGFNKEDILNGISSHRNPNLANIFFRLGLIEAYGTGLRRIYELYKNYSTKPEIHISDNSFKIILPNINEMTELTQTDIILGFIRQNGHITETDIEELLNIKATRAYKIAKELCDNGVLIKQGRGKDKIYKQV